MRIRWLLLSTLLGLMTLLLIGSLTLSATPPVSARDLETATPTPAPPTPPSTPTPTPPTLNQRIAADPDLKAAICQPDMAFTLKEGQIAAPILLYHFVGRHTMEYGGRSTSRFNVTAADFDAQLAILQQLGYQTVTISEISAALSGTLTLPARPVALTVDDGWAENYTVIFPLLQKYGMRATFYIPSTYPIGGRFVTWEQLQAMVAAGMEVGSHTRKHVNLRAVSGTTAWYELDQSKKTLEEKLGVSIVSVAYPYGNYAGSTLGLAQKAGYQAAVALGGTLQHSEATRYTLARREVFGTKPLTEFVKWLPWRGEGTALCPTPEPAHQPQ